jgi:hypothetical protein
MSASEEGVRLQDAYAVRQWLFALLRFALTLEPTDRALVIDLAAAMDGFSAPGVHAGFTFFVRTSIQICNAIGAKDHAQSTATLRGFLRNIDDLPLRRSFEAALAIKPPPPNRLSVSYANRQNLWQGLPARSAGQTAGRDLKLRR